MHTRLVGGLVIVAASLGIPARAQELPPGYIDPAPVLRAAADAIGVANLRCVTISGSAYAGMVGQQRLHGYEVDWPRGEQLTNYTRDMNGDAGTMVQEFGRGRGHTTAVMAMPPGRPAGRSGSPSQRDAARSVVSRPTGMVSSRPGV